MSTAFAETERFILRKLTVNDVTREYLSWFEDPEIKKYIVTAPGMATMDSLKSYVQEKTNDPTVIFCGIFTKVDRRHIGNIKFEIVAQKHHYRELGILIGAADWRGQGVGNEVISACGEKLADLGVTKIFLGVQKINSGAIRLYEKVGFKNDSSGEIHVDPVFGLAMSWDISKVIS